MLLSENVIKWALRLYPPLFFQRIRVLKVHPGFRGANVRVKKSMLNINYNRSIFGGTLFAAADPIYPVLFHQALSARGRRVSVWMKSAQIEYLRPARTDLHFEVELRDEDIAAAERSLDANGKHIRSFTIGMKDREGTDCVAITAEVYIRNLHRQEERSENTNE